MAAQGRRIAGGHGHIVIQAGLDSELLEYAGHAAPAVGRGMWRIRVARESGRWIGHGNAGGWVDRVRVGAEDVRELGGAGGRVPINRHKSGSLGLGEVTHVSGVVGQHTIGCIEGSIRV